MDVKTDVLVSVVAELDVALDVAELEDEVAVTVVVDGGAVVVTVPPVPVVPPSGGSRCRV